VLLGLDDETDEPLRLDLDEVHHLLIAGPQRSGRTSLLATCLRSSLDSASGQSADWYLAAPRGSGLGGLERLDNCRGFARSAGELAPMLSALELEVTVRRERSRGVASGSFAPVMIVVDDWDVLGEDDEFPLVQTRLMGLAKRGRLVGVHVFLAGFNVELRRFNNTFVQQFAQVAAAAVLQPEDADGDMFGGLRLRRLTGEVPPGRGYLVVRRQPRLFQAAIYPVEALA
jgi:S-DNA-T family DNA segregation ATPase FtsK/SpoIIIE